MKGQATIYDKRADRIKIVWWDGSGVCLYAKRLETITRKNSLFAGSDGGGRTWATIATLLQTCKMNEVDPVAWLTLTLERISDQWPNADLDELMPWNYNA